MSALHRLAAVARPPQGAVEAKTVLHEEYGLDADAASALLPFIGTQLEAGREPPQGEAAVDEPSN